MQISCRKSFNLTYQIWNKSSEGNAFSLEILTNCSNSKTRFCLRQVDLAMLHFIFPAGLPVAQQSVGRANHYVCRVTLGRLSTITAELRRSQRTRIRNGTLTVHQVLPCFSDKKPQKSLILMLLLDGMTSLFFFEDLWRTAPTSIAMTTSSCLLLWLVLVLSSCVHRQFERIRL